MADEPTEAPAAEPATETSPATEDKPQGDDLNGLKSALETERTQRKEFEKELKALRAADEKRQQEAMSETEKAIAAAKAEGASEAMKAVGVKLAAAELRSAAKDKGLNLADVTDLLKVETFVGDDGEVDEKAIKKAVDALAKIAPAPAKSGAPIPGGSGGRPNQNPTLDSAVAARYGM